MDKTDRDRQWNIWYLVSAVLGVLFLRLIFMQWQLGEPMPYSEFLQELRSDNVKEVAIYDSQIQGVLNRPRADGRTVFVTTRVDRDLAEELTQHKVKFSGVIQSTLIRDILGWVLPVLLFVGIWMFVIRRMMEKGGLGSGFMSIGKSHAKVYVEQDTRVTFDDVAGVDEAKEELQEVIGFLRDPGSYGRLGARVPRGILLVGPPGTGKTLLARAVAGEASVPFFSINGSEFVEMFVGVGAARVRDMFEQARQKSPAIIFIDEIDALGRARGEI